MVLNLTNMSLRTFLSVLLIGLLPLTARCAGLDSNTRADFEWFSKLGFPDVKGREFVRVATGNYTQVVDQPASARNSYINGFLLSTNRDTFTIFSLGLVTRTYTNSLPGTADYKHVGMEPADVLQSVREELQSLRSPPKYDYVSWRFGTSISKTAEAFVLAWACWRQGLEAQAQELYNEAKATPSPYQADHAEPVFRVALENDFAQVLMCRATDAFGNPTISRPELLHRFETILTNYPDSKCAKSNLETVTALKRMIAEDEEHQQAGPKDLNQLSTEQKVRELIFRLRDQNGQQIGESVDIFQDWYVRSKLRTTNTPAHQLVAIGYAAVPQLIQALDSRTLTRSVGLAYYGYYPGHVLTVGDCAGRILERITGKRFARAAWTRNGQSYSYDSLAPRKAAEAWWTEFQKKGEKQMLIDEVATPSNEDAPTEAVLLREKYPDAAAAPFMRGIRAATNSTIARELIRQLGILDQPAGMEFLKDELYQGPSLESRVASAFALRHREKNLAIDAMIREWQKVPNQVDHDPNDEWELVIDFLGTCDSPQAITALAANLRERSPKMRLRVISALGMGDAYSFEYPKPPPSPETRDSMEKCLVAELDDTQVVNYNATYNDTTFSNPRLCDVDRYFLAKHWPKQYTDSTPFKGR